MSYRRFQVYFFVTVLTLSGVLTLAVFWPYLTLLAFGGVLAVLMRPVHAKFLSWLKAEVPAAFLTVVSAAVAIILPTAFFFAALSAELVGAVGDLRGFLDEATLSQTLLRILPSSMHDQIPAILEEGLRIVRAIAGLFSASLVGIFSNLFAIVFGFMVVLICTYYLLKDGAKVKKELLALSPLGDEYDQLVFDRIAVAVRAVMGGVIILGLLKGVLTSLAFWVFGIEAPLFWGAMAGFASFVPILGTSLVTIPAIIYLFLIGKFASAIALLIISVAIIGTVDNFLQPKLVESKTNIHPLLILLAILGGLQLYGFAGFVLGPLTLAVTMAMIDIYKKEFRIFVERIDS